MPEVAVNPSDADDNGSLETTDPYAAYRVTFGFKLAHLCTFAGVIVANLASMMGWFPNGKTTADLSDEQYTPLTPHDYTFFIWILIYALQTVALLDLFTPLGYRSGKKGKIMHAIDTYWMLGWLSQAGWIVSFQFDTSTGNWVAFGFLCAATAFFGLSLIRLHAYRGWFNLWYYTLYLVSSSISTAWLSVATLLGALVVMQYYGLSEELMKYIGLGIGLGLTVIGLLFIIMGRDIFYGLTLIWAFCGIWIEQDDLVVRATLGVLIILLVAVIVVRLVLALVIDVRRGGKRANESRVHYDEMVSQDASDLEGGSFLSARSTPASASGSGQLNKAPAEGFGQFKKAG